MVGFFIKASLLLSWQRWIPMATCLLVNMSLNQPLLDLLDLLVDCFKAGLDHLGPWLKVLTMAQKVFNTMKVTRINIIHAHEAVPKCAKWLFNPQSLVGRKSHETKQFHTASQRILIPQQKQVTRRQMPLLGLVSTLAKHRSSRSKTNRPCKALLKGVDFQYHGCKMMKVFWKPNGIVINVTL